MTDGKSAFRYARAQWALPLPLGLVMSLACLLPPTPARAQAPAATPALRAHRVPDGIPPPVLDGRVDEPVWMLSEPSPTFTQQYPEDGVPSSEHTDVRVLFNRTHVFIAIVCFDRDPSQIMVTQGRRDGGLEDGDSVQLVLDTFHDRQNAFVFGTNPIGVEYDGQLAAEGTSDNAFDLEWDADWTVRSSVTTRGWEAEFAIPFRTLRYRAGTDRTWGFNVLRVIRRRNEQSFLAPVPRAYSLYRVSLAAALTGLELPARRDVRLIPFALGASDRDSGRTDVGIDVKWGLGPTLTADFTVNTDFAQVEADNQQVNLTRFPLFFPEKRPFFLENASIFRLGAPQRVELFFSRRIGLSDDGRAIGIRAGARVSGRIGKTNLGFLNIQTEGTPATGNGVATVPVYNFSVARVQRQFGRSSAGGVFVGRLGVGDRATSDDHNRAYGLDLDLQVTPNSRWLNFIARTDSGGGLGSDYAARSEYQYVGIPWEGSFGITQVGERFNPEVGFVPRQGYRQASAYLQRSFFPKRWPAIRRMWPHADWSAEYGFDGLLQSSFVHWDYQVTLRDGAGVGSNVDTFTDRPPVPFDVHEDASGRRVTIAPRQYSWTQFNMNYTTNPSAPMSADIVYTTGGFYDGRLDGWTAGVGARVGARVLARAGWTHQRVDLPVGRFRTDLVPITVSYFFTTRVSAQALVQFNSRAATLSSNVRFAWLNRSGTGLFVVYNDQQLTAPRPSRELPGRSLTVKLTRLFDF